MISKKIYLLLFAFYQVTNSQRNSSATDAIIQAIFGTQTSSTNSPNLEEQDRIQLLGDVDPDSSDACECVDYYLCPNKTLNTNGEGIIDVRISECGSYLEKCCPNGEIKPPPSPSPPPSKSCGFRNTNGVGFKIEGATNQEAEFGEFPWMTAIFYRLPLEDNTKSIPVYQCGGALIQPQVVLTAAHCVKDKENLKIRAGEWDTQTKKEQFPFQDRDVADVAIHPKFTPGPLLNDVALLFLETPVDMAPHINVVCLPPDGLIVDNSRCFTTGWGKNSFGKEDRYQVILKKIDLPMVPRGMCQEYLRNTRLGKFFTLDASFVCAGGEKGRDACTGDGGSPLVCPIEGYEEKYFQVGIVAWGIGCGDFKVPGVYVNVDLFRKWIDEELTSRNIDISVYKY